MAKKPPPNRTPQYRADVLRRLTAVWALRPEWGLGRLLLHCATVSRMAADDDEGLISEMERWAREFGSVHKE